MSMRFDYICGNCLKSLLFPFFFSAHEIYRKAMENFLKSRPVARPAHQDSLAPAEIKTEGSSQKPHKK